MVVKLYLIEILILISLITNDIENIFIFLSTISAPVNCLFTFFTHFSFGLHVFSFLLISKV